MLICGFLIAAFGYIIAPVLFVLLYLGAIYVLISSPDPQEPSEPTDSASVWTLTTMEENRPEI
jgi:hypothetical protein